MARRKSDVDNALFSDLIGVMAKLRSPSGCPWDREQDHRSLRPCLIEEAYEVLEAIDRDDAEALQHELGDLLLQIIFHGQLAAEAGRFDMNDVVRALRDKLVARHPHVFGDRSLATAEDVLHEWDSLKRKERGALAGDLLAEVPGSLPALARAQIVQRRAARAGFRRRPREARAAAETALAQLTQERGEPGAAQAALEELLLAAVDLAREANIDAEQALRERVGRFVTEFGQKEAGTA